jgi:hypothetical protein
MRLMPVMRATPLQRLLAAVSAIPICAISARGVAAASVTATCVTCAREVAAVFVILISAIFARGAAAAFVTATSGTIVREVAAALGTVTCATCVSVAAAALETVTYVIFAKRQTSVSPFGDRREQEQVKAVALVRQWAMSDGPMHSWLYAAPQ